MYDEHLDTHTLTHRHVHTAHRQMQPCTVSEAANLDYVQNSQLHGFVCILCAYCRYFCLSVGGLSGWVCVWGDGVVAATVPADWPAGQRRPDRPGGLMCANTNLFTAAKLLTQRHLEVLLGLHKQGYSTSE